MIKPPFVVGMAKEFRTAMRQEPDADLAVKLVVEETAEFEEALDRFIETADPTDLVEVLKEIGDFIYVLAGLAALLEDGVRPSQEALAAFMATEEVYESATDFEATFISPEQMLEIVTRIHASNMSKLGDDGQPIYDHAGKVLKGPNYRKPDLTDIADAIWAKYGQGFQFATFMHHLDQAERKAA